MPLMLVRGMRKQSVVDDADEAELLRRLPGARIEHVEEAGHSVQGDTPVELAALHRRLRVGFVMGLLDGKRIVVTGASRGSAGPSPRPWRPRAPAWW